MNPTIPPYIGLLSALIGLTIVVYRGQTEVVKARRNREELAEKDRQMRSKIELLEQRTLQLEEQLREVKSDLRGRLERLFYELTKRD